MTDNDQPTYRVGRHNPRNLYRGDEHMGVVFDPADGPRVVAALNVAERGGICWDCTKGRHGICTGQDDAPPVGTGGACVCKHEPRDTDDQCGDEWQPAHGAGTHPQDCRTCSEQQPRPLRTPPDACVLPDVTSYLTKALTVRAMMDRIMGADHYGTRPPFDVQHDAHPAGCGCLWCVAPGGKNAPPIDVQVKGIPMDLRSIREISRDGSGKVTVQDQCPTCTSPYRHHRFVLPDPADPADKVIICVDDWHNDMTGYDEAHMCQGVAPPAMPGPAPCGRTVNHRAHPLGIPPALPDAVEGDTTERTWTP
jgi:hypothetical protein